ncbi:hypothetical protein [Halomonas halophila]
MPPAGRPDPTRPDPTRAGIGNEPLKCRQGVASVRPWGRHGPGRAADRRR